MVPDTRQNVPDLQGLTRNAGKRDLYTVFRSLGARREADNTDPEHGLSAQFTARLLRGAQAIVKRDKIRFGGICRLVEKLGETEMYRDMERRLRLWNGRRQHGWIDFAEHPRERELGLSEARHHSVAIAGLVVKPGFTLVSVAAELRVRAKRAIEAGPGGNHARQPLLGTRVGRRSETGRTVDQGSQP